MIGLGGKIHLDKRARRALLCAAVLLPLAACSGESGSGGHDGSSAPPPPMTGDTIKPLVVPGGPAAASLGPVKPADAKPAAPVKPETIAPIPTPMETFRSLAPPEGLKVTPLFAEPVKDPDARMARVEKAVQDLRNDFDTVMPAMVRMVAMENNLRDLIDQMKAANDTAKAVPPPAAMPPAAAAAPAPEKKDDKKIEAKPAAKKSAAKEAAPAKAPAAAPGAVSVKALRLGDHGDTTRIVLELSAKAAAAAALDTGGKQLVIDLAQVNWTGKDSGGMKGGKLISSWKYTDGKLHIDLRHPAAIKSQKLLPPAAGNKDFRLVIDLAAAEPSATKPAKPAAPPAPAPAAAAKPAGG
jgi:hypothetical protein